MTKCEHTDRQEYRLELCQQCYERSVIVLADGKEIALYTPQDHQVLYHQSDVSNLLALGTRGTGKSLCLRWDALTRCLMFPGFKALILRRKLNPDLRMSHLQFIAIEAKALGAKYRDTIFDVRFQNGSILQFSHCEDNAALENYLSSQWDYIGFDELSTFDLEQFLKISAAARTITVKPYRALIRACSNPLGRGAVWMKQWFIDKVVDYGEYPDYNPDHFDMQFSTLDDNKYVNRKEYEAHLKNLPEHVRRAWLLGEFVFEGAYFTDFRKKTNEGLPWHVIPNLPTWKGQPLSEIPWLAIYRSIDWGYFPDPAVCLWIAVLPNGHSLVFKEKKWQRTLAADVARDILAESVGMHIVETFCDPTMFVKTGTIEYSIGEIFETHGVPLTPSQNDRELYGYSIHDYLNTLIDEHPKLQIVEGHGGAWGCKDLLRTLPIMQMDPNDSRKIKDGDDHWVVALAYFCMGRAAPVRDPQQPIQHAWMMSRANRNRLQLAKDVYCGNYLT